MTQHALVAIVPMRHLSERVPGKNYRPFAGRPLYHWITETLLACPSIEQVVIDTDSDWIREDATRTFPMVDLLERPPHLRDGHVPMTDVLLNDVERIHAKLYLQTHSTNPLLTADTVETAIRSFRDSAEPHDSLFSVTSVHGRFWDRDGRPVNHDPARLLRTQDLAPLYEENSCLYLFTKAMLVERRSRIGRHPLLFEIDRAEAWDLDTQVDFEVAEFLHQRRAAAHRS